MLSRLPIMTLTPTLSAVLQAPRFLSLHHTRKCEATALASSSSAYQDSHTQPLHNCMYIKGDHVQTNM